MPLEQWTLLTGAVLSACLAIGPWMFKVHAKLAVIASKVDDLCAKLDHLADDRQRLWESSGRHQSRLDTHDVQLTHLAERLKRNEEFFS